MAQWLGCLGDFFDLHFLLGWFDRWWHPDIQRLTVNLPYCSLFIRFHFEFAYSFDPIQCNKLFYVLFPDTGTILLKKTTISVKDVEKQAQEFFWSYYTDGLRRLLQTARLCRLFRIVRVFRIFTMQRRLANAARLMVSRNKRRYKTCESKINWLIYSRLLFKVKIPVRRIWFRFNICHR